VLGVLDTNEFTQQCADAGYWRDFKTLYKSQTSNLRPNEVELIRTFQLEAQKSDLTFENEMREEYPSHMHIDLEPELQGKGYGRTMVLHLLDALRQGGSCGVHLKMASNNGRAFRFYCKLGFEKLRGDENDKNWTLGLKL